MKHFKDDCFMLWRNEPCIIVGMHQNTLAEINLEYVNQKQIKVVRRLSGGGAVFHDLGNLNFTFVANTPAGSNMVDFHKFTLPILEALKSLNVNAEFTGRNDLTIEGKKFSGNAEHVYKNRVLHHGTLLFSSEMADLSNALKVDPSKFSDKAVKSVRARVTNISEHLQEKLDVIEFRDIIMKHVMSTTENSRVYSFTKEDIEAVSRLRDEKYSTYDWNYGHSPKYNFAKKIKTTGGHVEVALFVENGIIREAKIYGDFFHILDPSDIEQALIGITHDEGNIRKRLSDFAFNDYFVNISLEEFVQAMF